jgi:hypothetical protein
MSEQPQQTQGQEPKWGDDIGDERKAELDARLQAWAQETDHGTRRGPFDGIELTGATDSAQFPISTWRPSMSIALARSYRTGP